MILYEYEGKELLKKAGIVVPKSLLVTEDSISSLQKDTFPTPCVLKAQVLSGKRADVGGIVMVEESSDISHQLSDLFKKTINGEKVEKVLIEEKVQIGKEYYLSISYDTDVRSPVLSFSEQGGTGIEERKIDKYTINPVTRTVDLPHNITIEPLQKLIDLFFDQDCLLLEINPLVVSNGKWIALDAKIKLDDDAKARHEDWDFLPRQVAGRRPTEREIEARKIDEGDYRGTAGSAYFDLDGDIAILSSGGGVSLTAMDALITAGGKPANFTEYSGNPPKEKVVKLTKIVLSKPNIHGLWVVGTVAANFTDIYETLSGLIDGLRATRHELQAKLDFPIIIRRGGPRDKEAFEMLKQVKDFDLTLQGEETSISQSAQIMAEKAREYAQDVIPAKAGI